MMRGRILRRLGKNIKNKYFNNKTYNMWQAKFKYMWINFKQIKYYQISTLKAEIKISYTVWILLTKSFKQEFFFLLRTL
jgi:hypothetical protein